MKRLLLFALALGIGCLAGAQHYPYQDKTLSPTERATDLLSRLTVEEKASLMMNAAAPIPRLGIKQYNWWNEALHGVGRNGSATVFPQAIGMAAAFDDDLLYEVFTAVSDEARVKNRIAKQQGPVNIYQGLTFWTPNINIFRDPRWGRGMETYGEDPYLTGKLGMAVVRGLQGPDDSPIRKAHACAKHYAVHSGPESTRHRFNAWVSERDLRETYLPAFKDLVTKANVEEVMTAYNRVEGVPAAASNKLINDILRGEWGFKGIITSDCWAIADFYEPGRHGYSPDAASAAAAAVIAGVNTECGNSYTHLPEAYARGLVSEKQIDNALLPLMIDRYELGEMDDVSLWDHLPESIVEGPEHKALALKMARASIVLLQNRDNLLPLKKNQKIAIVGPNADDKEMMWGNYNGIPKETVTLLEAFRTRMPKVKYFRGCGIIDKKYQPARDTTSRFARFMDLSEEELNEVAKQYAIGVNDIKNYVKRQQALELSFEPELDADALLAQLKGIDIVVFAGGISPRFEGEEMPVNVPGFTGGDKTDIELPDVQRRLLKALHEAGKKVVFVNFSGSAMGFVPETESCDAIVQAWYPGQMGGTAITDVLFGDVNPSGKLPVTFYKSIEQLPDFENYEMEGHTYRFFRGEPLFPFGYGLSYSAFRYGDARIEGRDLVIPVTNISKRAGEEIVQLYVRKPDDPDGPVKTLRGFRRVNIPAGKTVEVRMPLTDETFNWWDVAAWDVKPVREDYVLLYGGSSADASLKSLDYSFR